ncbi:MAG: hypothetical protein ABIJ56_05455 [Pseudomonadota bacterium]
MRNIITSIVLFALTACYAANMPNYENQSYPDFNEKKLKVGKSFTKTSFLSYLKKKGATNIIASEGYISGKVVTAITADFLDNIYIFSDSRYAAKLEIKYDEGKPQTHPVVKVVYSKGEFGFLLVADNMRLGGKRVAQLILVGKGGKITNSSISLESLIEKNDGLFDPFIGGENLESGLVFSARDRTGRAWGDAYLLTIDKSKLRLEKKTREHVFGCSCFADWLQGKDGREVFGMKIK